jgi:acetyltransferase-like isoleucine patch superfamily enzyme
MLKKYIKKILPNYLIDILREIYIESNFSKKQKKYKHLLSDYSVHISGECMFEDSVKVNDKNVFFSDVIAGKNTYFAGYSYFYNCKIGRYCSIGPNVRVGLGIHPSKKTVSTHPSFYTTSQQSPVTFASKNFFEQVLPIIIGNDVWIGYGVTIKDGVTVGDGAIIGANALVTNDVEPYSIVGGVPAKLIRKRFSEQEIKFLLAYKWWNKEDSWFKASWQDFLDIESFIKKHSQEISL